MEISYSGKITKADFLKCILISSPQLRYQKWFFGFMLICIASSFLLSKDAMPSFSTDTVSYMLPVVVVSIVFFTFPWWLPYVQLSSYDQKGNIYRKEVFGIITEDGISINNSEIKANLQWSIYTNYKLDKDIFLLFQGKHGFNAFKPNMFKSQDEWNNFINIAKNKVTVDEKRA